MAYLGTQPNDVKKNTGLYTPSEILQLTKDGSWGGSLELIAEQTISSGSTLNFTSIKENVYDVHFVIGKNIESSSANTAVKIRLSNDSGSSYEAGTNYQIVLEYGTTGGTFGEAKSTGTSALDFTGDTANQNKGAYCYLYNLGNNAKYSFQTFQNMEEGAMNFGVGVYTTAETINAIQFLTTNSNAWTGTIEIYGVKQI